MKSRSLFWLALAMIVEAAGAAPIIHVHDLAAGANDGSSWANAFTNLQDALAAPGVTEIWVAAGTYKPAAAGGNRDASFELRNGLALYGGFAGTELAREQRQPDLNITILSGDLNGDDGQLPGLDNSEHVVHASGTDASAILDGFTVASGNGAYGAGIFIANGTMTLRHCVIRNHLGQIGAGLYCYDGTLTIEDCRFENNLVSGGRGGAIGVAGDTTDATLHPLTLRRCTFAGNTATGVNADGYGGAVYADFDCPVDAADCSFLGNEARWRFTYGQFATAGGAALTFADGCVFTRCLFRQNRAHEGGALWLGGNTSFVNCLFVGNEAFRVSSGANNYGGYGGAILAFTANITVSSCTLHANHARSTGGIFVSLSSTAAVENSILWSNTATEEDQKPLDPQIGGASPFTLAYCCVRDLLTPIPGEDPPEPDKYPGCITNAPSFVDERGPDNVAGNADDDLRLEATSPCLDAGSNLLLPAGVATDFTGGPRRFDAPAVDTGAGSAPITDMGAHEFVIPLLLQLTRMGDGSLELNWNPWGTGWSYSIESRDDLNAAFWQTLVPDLASPPHTIPSASVTNRGYFRVRAALLPTAAKTDEP